MYTFSSLCGNILLDGTGDRFRLAQNELDDRRIKVGEWEFINIQIRNMRASTKIFYQAIVVTLVIVACQSISTCHVLCNCTNSACISCYANFQSNSSQTAPAASTCPCPTGFYTFNNACMFCPDNCKVCNDGNTCLECYPGYTKNNGTCINIKYAQGVTWVLYESEKDFKPGSASTPSSFGFSLLPLDPSVSKFFVDCPTISNQMLLGFKSSGNLSASLLRTYHGLPYHQWAHITIKYAALDNWNGQKLQTDLYLDARLANKTYRNLIRNTNLCGGSEPDSIDQIHSEISHDKLSLALNFTIPANVTLAIKSIKLDVGTCPRNCLSCSGPTNCLVCKSYYINVNGACQCNTNLSHPVSYGCLQLCKPGQLFVPGLERCTLCSRFITDCFNCFDSSICTQCNKNTFLLNGKCVLKCPSPYFPKKAPGYTSHCHLCSANCTTCFNQTLCLQCESNLYLNQGQCVSSCPPGHSNSGGRCYPPTVCPTGCSNCSGGVCTSCQLGFWMSGTTCLYDCPPATYKSPNKTCLPCSINCLQCVDNQTCQTCSPSFTLRNGTCQYYSTTCNLTGYYFDPRVRLCVACPEGCSSCYRTLCSICMEGYYLDNGACVAVCSAEKYQITDNISTNNKCFWRNQICLDQFNTSQNSCSKCRSLDYIVALTSDSACQTFCPPNKTFSPHSYNYIENSRFCNVSCGANCQICIDSAICVKCASGYVILGRTPTSCVSSCGNGYLSDSVQCLNCQYGCNTCDMNGNCLSWSQTPTNTSCSSNCLQCIGSNCVACGIGYYLNSSGTCQTSCPTGTFMDSSSRQCRKCQPQCQQCTAFSVCSKCIDGFYLSGESCVRSCPPGTYPNQEQGSCDACAVNCRTCYGPKPYQCLSCYLGYSKDHSECVAACPLHKYEDIYGSCDWCHQSCRYCFGPTEFQCLECGLANYLYQGECFNYSCPAATYLAVYATRECYDCSRGCAYCNSYSDCQLCSPGFYLFNGECLDVCPINMYYSWQNASCLPCSPFCASCLSSSCYQCLQTHYLYDGACISSCPNGTFVLDYYYGQQCRACPPLCHTCATSYQCTSCADGLILRNGQCTRFCEPGKYFDIGTGGCRECASNCVSCTSWGCTECRVGYYEYNSTCIQACPTGTYSIPETAQCGACPSTCLNCTTFYQCTQCRANYTLLNGVCRRNQSCSTNCLNCADASTCILCRQGYYRFTNASGVYCTQVCPARYYLYAGSQCAPCQPQCLACVDGVGCTQCQTGLILFMGQCIADCFPGFYLTFINSTLRCEACSAQCQTCTLRPNNCTICWSPTAVVENGTCVQKRQCLLSSFYSESIGYCVPCTAHCRICHNPTQCDECLTGFFITEDKLCRGQCSNGTFQSTSAENPSALQCTTCPFPCLICLSSNQCTNCYAGYPLNTTSGQCQTNCDRQSGYFLNSHTNTCERCNERCLECTGTSTSCTQCAAGYYLIGNQCVLQCPEGTFSVVTARSCLPCGQNCQTCTQQANCQRCLINTVNFNGSCLPVCPSGYYQANGACLPCVLPCRECTGGSIYECSTCEQGSYFFNNRCIQNCPEGYFRYSPSSSCRACPAACRNCTSFTSCQACQANYTLNPLTQQCQTTPICPSSLPYCQSCRRNTVTNTTQCTFCFSGFYLQAGQCVSECNRTYFENRLSGYCQTCQQNCLTCIDADSCTECAVGFYLFNQRCYGVCPNGTYPYVENRANVSINSCRIDPCVHYMTVNFTQQCLICVSPFILYNGQCISVCPAGTYRSQLSCQPCQPGCTQCVDLLHCTNCSSGYHFYNFQCFDDCPVGTYPYVRPNGTSVNNGIQDGECLPCSNSCLVCITATQCSRCSAGFFFTADGRCVTLCPVGFYANSLTGNCDPCSPSCSQCLSLDTCRRCSTGSYLIAGQCVTQCPVGTYPVSGQCQPCLQYCRTCGISSNCTQCDPGFMLNRVTNQCVRSCPVGTYVSYLEQCLPCPTACASCSNPNECVSCRSPAILFNGNCTNQCPSGYTLNLVSNTCIECDPFCRECTNLRDNCTACQQGYQLTNGYCQNICPSHTFRNSSGQCQSCTSASNNGSCAQCYGLAIDQCIECFSPYYLLNNVCVQNCPNGYYGTTTILRECLPCDTGCLNCAGSPRNCTLCPWGYFLVNGTCLASCPSRYYAHPDPTNSSCLPCIPPCVQCMTQNSCTSCISGYFLTPFGTCTTNCSTLPISSSASAYFFNANTSSCEPCSANCVNCTSPTQCSRCELPSHIYLNECVQDCPASTFLNYNNICQPCNQTYCTTCTSSTSCTQCLAGVAYLINGTCVISCPSGYLVLDGRCVINNNNDTVCTLFWLNTTNGSSCVEYCPNGYYPSNTAHQCLPCPAGCVGCTTASNCQICQSPYMLFNNSCLSVCPSGYVQVNEVCVRCDDSCQTCSPSPTQCTSCPPNYYLFNSQCVRVCPDGYFPDLVSKSCARCAEPCLRCSSFSQCSDCKNTRYTPPSCRDTVCNSTQYKIESTGQCANCDTNCLACYGGSSANCLTCRSPLVMIDGQCRSACPLSYILSPTNNTCIPCPTNCRTCTYVSTNTTPRCVQCFSPKILNDNVCLQDCSVIQTSVQAYTSNGSACYPCSAYCLDCVVGNNGSTNCIICRAGYILYMGNCVSQCPNGYYPIQGSCHMCPLNCTTCSSQANSCTNCTNNTYLYNGACVQPCPNATYANNLTFNCLPCTDLQCVRCSSSASICEECIAPFTVDPSTRNCRNCVLGFLFNMATRMCEACAEECLSCSVVVNNCTSCTPTRALLQGRCIEQCPEAYYLFTINTTRECRRCPSNCITCRPLTSISSECDRCAPGYYRNLANNQCVAQCPSNTFVTNTTDCSPCSTECLTCNATNSCTSCPNGYYRLNNRCVNVCPAGYAAFNGSCQVCPVGCISCSTPTNCTNCRNDYRLNTTTRKCDEILPCVAGKYMDLNGTCQNCSANCLLCSSLQNCTQCSLPYFLRNGQCSSSCLSNQYSIIVASLKYCVDCLSPCDKCISNTSCTHCSAGYFLTANNTCVSDCGDGYYPSTTVINNVTQRNCTPCADTRCRVCTMNGCRLCEDGFYLFGLIPFNMTNGSCFADCPAGYYKDNSIQPFSCTQCNVAHCDQCNATQCFKCLPPYILLINNGTSSCVSQCPNGMVAITTNNIAKCENCMTNCLQCSSFTWCRKCDPAYYLYTIANLTVGNNLNYNTSCLPQCPERYFQLPDTLTHNNTCQNCEPHCLNCTNDTNCIQCFAPAYILVDHDCVPYKCLNCTTCVNQKCQLCDAGYYLFEDNSQCYSVCPEGYWGNPQTKKCEVCMDNCLKCPTKADCSQCKDGFNFTGYACVDQAYVTYGVLSNMSGFTSNITEITSAVYIGTSVGPMVFGEMTTTYFNIEFCQFILFHAKASGNNSEMEEFLGSLQSISLTMSPNTAQNGKRRLLASSLADPATFLVTSVPIFAMMGGFLLVFALIHIFQKNANSCCLSCPRFHFYVTEICEFMKKRFKWIYFDFVAWVSYLPFLYFSLMQLQKFSFATALEGFSCILSLVIVVVYPLYPFFIGYLLKENYNDLVHQNNQLTQMSLSPYVYKVKRPTKQLVAGQPWKDYFNAENLRLAYDPLKYLRKFIFVLVIAVCHEPVTSLIVLIILNLIFIGYMAVFRPRLMPYLIFDFIIEGVLLFFEIFMLVYLTNQSAKVSAMSIAAHAVGFLTANLSLAIAIILNLIAYYKIFMCIYDMVKHLREKLQEKQKGELKDSEEIQPEHDDMDLPEKEQENLTKSLRGSRRIRNRNGEDVTELDQSENNNSTLIKDKEIFGNGNSGINGELKRSIGGLPDLKSTKLKKKQQAQQEQNSENYLFQDKELPKRERVQNDEELTQSNPNSKISKIQSGILKDKELYKGSSGDITNSTGQIPDLKASNKKCIRQPVRVIGSNVKLKQTSESDQDFMIRSGMQGQEVIAVKDGKLKEVGSNKFKRSSFLNPGEVAVTQGIPIAGSDKFRRNMNNLPKIDSVSMQNEQESVQNGNLKQINRKKGQEKATQLQNARFKQLNRNRQQNNHQIQDGEFVENRKRKSTNNQQNEQIQQGNFKQHNRGKIMNQREQQRDEQVRYQERKNYQLNIPNLTNQLKRQKPSESIDLLEASFVDQQPPKRRQAQNDQQDLQDIYNISLNAKSLNKKINGQSNQQQYEKGRKEQEKQVQQGKFTNLGKKEYQKNATEDFDQFMEDNPRNLNLKQRQKAAQNKNVNEKAQEEIEEVPTKQRKDSIKKNYKKDNQGKSNQQDPTNLITNQRNKKSSEKTENLKYQKQAVIEGGKLIQHKGDKFKRKSEKNIENLDEQKINYVDVQGKKITKNKKEVYLDQQQQDIEKGKLKDRSKKKVSGQASLASGAESNYTQKRKLKKNFKGEADEGQLDDQYQRQKKRQQGQAKNKKGHLGINQEGKQEQYDEICRRNKDNMFSPDKGILMDSLNVNDFNDSDYESRPESKIQRPGSRGKGVLGVGDTGSANDSDDSNSVRHQRVSAIQKLRKKQGNLGVEQRQQYSGDESVSSRQEKEKKPVRRRQKSGILKIEKNNNDEEGMDSIQLQKKR